MDTIWLLTAILVNGHVIETVTMDQPTCRKAEMYSALGKSFQVKSSHGPIPVGSATCVRVENACPYTGSKLAMMKE